MTITAIPARKFRDTSYRHRWIVADKAWYGTAYMIVMPSGRPFEIRAYHN